MMPNNNFMTSAKGEASDGIHHSLLREENGKKRHSLFAKETGRDHGVPGLRTSLKLHFA